MLRRSDVLGLGVVELASGKRIGVIDDVVIDRTAGRLEGLLVKTAGGVSYVRHGDIQAFGQDAVTLGDKVLRDAGDQTERARSLATVLGKPVLSDDGIDMGTIDDICFDEETGAVMGYQVSGGLIQDLVEGKELLPFDSKLTYGEDAVIVHDLNET